ncbi:MAG: hypothetical protein K2X98_01080 [Alphaproteobacteria bacterium]|nr:hypothetical protein [Alphaproteobacteria bacterium]
MRRIIVLTTLLLVFLTGEGQTTPLSDKLSLPKTLDVPYNAMDIIAAFDTLYTHDKWAAENDAQLAHYLAFGKISDGTGGFIPATNDYLVRTDPNLTTADERAAIFKLLLIATHRQWSHHTMLRERLTQLAEEVPASLSKHMRGAAEYVDMVYVLIRNQTADVSDFIKRTHFYDVKKVFSEFIKERIAFSFMASIMEKFKSMDIPVAQRPFISRLLPKDQVKKILEVNLWLRQLQQKIPSLSKVPIEVRRGFNDARKNTNGIHHANSDWMKPGIIGYININLMQLRRDDIFSHLNPITIIYSSLLSSNSPAEYPLGGVNLKSFLDFGIPLFGYNMTQIYEPDGINLNERYVPQKIIVKTTNLLPNLNTFHANLTEALQKLDIVAESVDEDNLPNPIHYDWSSLKTYFLILRDKIQSSIQDELNDGEFEATQGMRTDLNNLNKMTSFNFYGLDFKIEVRDGETDQVINSVMLTPDQEKGTHFSQLKKLSLLSPRDFHDLDTYHLMWMIKMAMLVDKEKKSMAEGGDLIEKIKEQIPPQYWGDELNPGSLPTAERIDNLTRFWTFIETFIPDTQEEAEDFVVVMKQLIPRLEYGLQLRMLDGGPDKFLYTPIDFWNNLAE